MKKSGASQGQSASELISKRIAELGDWRKPRAGAPIRRGVRSGPPHETTITRDIEARVDLDPRPAPK